MFTIPDPACSEFHSARPSGRRQPLRETVVLTKRLNFKPPPSRPSVSFQLPLQVTECRLLSLNVVCLTKCSHTPNFICLTKCLHTTHVTCLTKYMCTSNVIGSMKCLYTPNAVCLTNCLHTRNIVHLTNCLHTPNVSLAQMSSALNVCRE